MATPFKDWLTSLTSKTPPIDADELYLRDSTGTPSSKKLTWANVKSALKTYFDGLYDPVGAAAAVTPTTLGLVISTNVQAYDADLTTWAGVTPGSGVATALAVNTNTAGGVTLNGSAGSFTTVTTTGGVLNRVLSATNYTTDTGTSLNCDTLDEFIVTAQAGALKFNNPTGTPLDGQVLFIAVTGTAARALTWDNKFEASTVALPSTTVLTARLNMGFIWRADTSKWVIVGAV